MAPAPIPQNDPKASYLAQRAEIDAAIARVLDSGWYILGKETAAFEAEFAASVGCRHGVGVGNGTDALVLALRALGIGAGDAVVTVAHTAVATVAAIELVGATPILIDIDPGTYTMDAGELARVLEAPPQGQRIAAVDAGASLRPGGGSCFDRRARPAPRRAAHRGLRAMRRRAVRGSAARQLRRHRLLQLLSDQESRRASATAASSRPPTMVSPPISRRSANMAGAAGAMSATGPA